MKIVFAGLKQMFVQRPTHGYGEYLTHTLGIKVLRWREMFFQNWVLKYLRNNLMNGSCICWMLFILLALVS